MTYAVLAALVLSPFTLPGSGQGAPPATIEFGGVYDGAGAGLLVVAPVNDTLIRYRDLGAGQIGTLARADGDRFGTDLGWIEFARTRDGRVARARWSLAAGATGRGERRPLRQEPISWTSGGEHLSGTLILPDTVGAHCAVVVQPGASWTSR